MQTNNSINDYHNFNSKHAYYSKINPNEHSETYFCTA